MLQPVHAGYELVWVSAIEAQYAEARLQNLRHCGFPIERMIATDNAEIDDSPKARRYGNCSRWCSSMTFCLTCVAFGTISMQP
jgi:hypothetical protein